MNDLNTALMLLAVGMITVFAILSLVVLSGRTLIYIINRWAPAHTTPRKAISREIALPSSEASINKHTLAAIVAAVDIWTEGKGRITKIEKQDER